MHCMCRLDRFGLGHPCMHMASEHEHMFFFEGRQARLSRTSTPHITVDVIASARFCAELRTARLLLTSAPPSACCALVLHVTQLLKVDNKIHRVCVHK